MSKEELDSKVSDGLYNAVAGLGTERDKRSYGAYATPASLDRQTLDAMYRTSWLAGKIVDIVADDMTREWLEWNSDDEEGLEQRNQLLEAERRLGVRAKVLDALKWSRLYGGALLVMVMADSVQNNAAMATPLDIGAVKAGDLKHLTVLDRWRVTASPETVQEMDSHYYGLPKYYVVSESGLQVHHTRVLRFNGAKLPYYSWLANARWDDSVLQRVYEKVRDADSISGSVASMVFEANVDVLRFGGLAELLAQKDGEAKVKKRLETALLSKSFTKALVLDEGDGYDKKTSNFGGLSEIMERVVVEICGAVDIPMTRLYGQSASGLNATGAGDARNYYDMLKAKQEADLRPNLERLYAVLAASEFGVAPKNFVFTFSSLWQMSDADKATLQAQRAQRDKIYVELGIVPEHVVANELLEDGTYKGLTPEVVEFIEQASGFEAAETEKKDE